MRKKYLLQLPAIMLAAMLGFGMSSCSKDDDESAGLKGTWVKWELDDNIAQGYTFKEKKTWEFNDDGKGMFTSEGTYTSKADSYNDSWYDTNTFSYTTSGDNSGSVKITILSRKGKDYNYEEGREYNWTYSINGNTLTMDQEQYLTAAAAEEPVPTNHTITMPEVSFLAATATSIEFNASIKVESEEYPDYCTLYYATSYYAPHSEPTTFQSVKCKMTKDMNGSSDKHIYYYSGSKAGFAGATTGSRIYYYAEVKNSAGTVKTPVQYVTIKGGMSY